MTLQGFHEFSLQTHLYLDVRVQSLKLCTQTHFEISVHRNQIRFMLYHEKIILRKMQISFMLCISWPSYATLLIRRFFN